MISGIVTPTKIGYLVTLLLPFAFLPLLSPLSLLFALPNLGINLTSSIVPMHYPFEYYYQVPIVTVLALATLMSLKKLNNIKPSYLKSISLSVFGLSLLTSVAVSPAPYSVTSSLQEFKISDHAQRVSEVKQFIPDEASLSIQNNLGPHFSQRMTLHTYPSYSDQAEYVVLDITDPNPIFNTFRNTRTFMFNTQMLPQEYYDSVISVLDNPNYEPVYFNDGYLIFENGAKAVISKEKLLNELNQRIVRLYDKYNSEVKTISP